MSMFEEEKKKNEHWGGTYEAGAFVGDLLDLDLVASHLFFSFTSSRVVVSIWWFSTFNGSLEGQKGPISFVASRVVLLLVVVVWSLAQVWWSLEV